MITIVRMVLQGVSVRRSISALVRLPFAVAVIVNMHLPLDYSPSSIISNHRRSPVTADCSIAATVSFVEKSGVRIPGRLLR